MTWIIEGLEHLSSSKPIRCQKGGEEIMKIGSEGKGINTKILFVCPSFSSFIQNDLDILRRFFDVRVAHYQGKKRLREFWIETLKGVLWADVTFFLVCRCACFYDGFVLVKDI